MDLDRYDLPLATASDRAAAFYRDGVDRLLSAWNGAAEAFDAAIAEDPDFALAHIARARIHQMNMEGAQARTLAAQARQLSQRASARERAHVEITAAAIEGRPKIALAGAEQHLEEYPRDALAISGPVEASPNGRFDCGLKTPMRHMGFPMPSSSRATPKAAAFSPPG